MSPRVGAEALRNAWRDLAASRQLTPDPAQALVLDRLADLQQRLETARDSRGAFARLMRWIPVGRPPATVRGLYLWGPPGRGKTLLVDVFFSTLPVPGRRQHFHHFMRDVHDRLRKLRRRPNPLDAVADQIASEARVVCLDELQVTDIADAMILYALFTALLRRGVCLVCTSNQPPGDLYKDGLQRERFLPAIALLERELDVHETTGATDFRLRNLQRAEVYLPSGDRTTRSRLDALFEQLSHAPTAPAHKSIELNGRRIAVVREAHDIAWFEFSTLCEGPRGQSDYIELAQLYHTLIVSDVPVLGADQDDAARRFMGLIDELYDRGVKLVLSAAAEPTTLYRGTRLAEAFQRTVSRLIEMRSADYLARPHRADAG
ncbi:MAG: cell division protein ZapE [Steroidobacteraceae bacterium]